MHGGYSSGPLICCFVRLLLLPAACCLLPAAARQTCALCRALQLAINVRCQPAQPIVPLLLSSGRLGIGALSGDVDYPVIMAGGPAFRSITSGLSHSCALDSQGWAWCWGVSRAPVVGGGNHSVHPSRALHLLGSPTLAAHEAATTRGPLAPLPCSLQSGVSGQLGNGANEGQSLPGPVAGNQSFAAIAAGAFHACAVAQDNSLWCWGEALANGKDNNANAPAAVSSNHTLVGISAAWNFTCGLDAFGDAWCFGASGGLGAGVLLRSCAWQRSRRWTSNYLSSCDAAACHSMPSRLIRSHALPTGANPMGELGDGSYSGSATPVQVAGGPFLSIGSACGGHHMCAIAGAGQAALGLPGRALLWLCFDASHERVTPGEQRMPGISSSLLVAPHAEEEQLAERRAPTL